MRGFAKYALLIIVSPLVFACATPPSAGVSTAAAALADQRLQTEAAQTAIAITPTFTLPPPTQTLPSTRTPSPTSDPLHIPSIAEASCLPRNSMRQQARLVSIVDGDTIEVEIDGAVYELRYIGIDTPERNFAFGEEAAARNQRLLGDQPLLLIKDQTETDRYGRLLRYVIAGDSFVNYELVRLGLAEAIAYEPDTACHAAFQEVQAAAAGANLGLWVPTPTADPVLPPLPSGCSPYYPDVCIAPPPPDLDCGDIPYRRFTVYSPDPHNFDGDHDGIGCES